MNVQAIDLFCGVGGLSYGLNQADIEVVAGLDNDKSCSVAYEKNNDARFILADISTYNFHQMARYFSDDSARVLVGCAPCQPFSSHMQKLRDREKDDRWNLISFFVKAIDVLKPDVISMENVPGLTKTGVFVDFVDELKARGFHVDFQVVYCPDYGVPQNRSRLVIVGSRLGEIRVPRKTHHQKIYKTVGNIIRALPRIGAGETWGEDDLHRAQNLTPINLKRIRQSKPNGTWRDWDKELLPRCFKKATGKSYTPVYGRMSWDDVSPTITTQFFNYGSGRFGHPEQDRALSVREGALLQTFPATYDFGDQKSTSTIAKHIGNAVPPRLGYVVGMTIRKHIESHHGG